MVAWNYQRALAEEVVGQLLGVRGLTNDIRLASEFAPVEVKQRIEAAFERSAHIDAMRLAVETQDGEVVLKGTVRSWAEREEAEQAAWSTPGVTSVDNRIIVTG